VYAVFVEQGAVDDELIEAVVAAADVRHGRG
jgi:hypothetical protein